MKASELIKALEEGKLLYRVYDETFDNVLYFYLNIYYVKATGKTFTELDARGWRSACDKKEILEDVVLNPEKWDIHEAMPDQCPWSSFSRYSKIKKVLSDDETDI